MIDGLKPYSAMKDSGVPRLGDVPEHWELASIRCIGQLFKGNGGSKEDEVPVEVPCVRYGDLYTKHEFFVRNTKAFVTPERAAHYTSIRYGDVLFAASGETIEDIGRSAVNLIETDACCGGDLLLLRPNEETVAKFLGYAADSDASRHQKACMGRGFTVVHIYATQLKQLVLPVPPLPEQSAIVRFLDYSDRRIRRYIRGKQKLIKLLEEQKRAIIHRAVTRGLDPNVRLKSSGAEWLGEVPDHWKVLPLRRRCTIIDCKHLTVPFVDDGISLASVREVKAFELSLDKAKRMTSQWYEKMIEGGRRPKRGDIIYCRNVSVGAAAIVNTDEPCSMGQDVCLIRSKQNNRYINYFLHSSIIEHQLAMVLVGSTFDRINVAAVKSLMLYFLRRVNRPPSLFGCGDAVI